MTRQGGGSFGGGGGGGPSFGSHGRSGGGSFGPLPPRHHPPPSPPSFRPPPPHHHHRPPRIFPVTYYPSPPVLYSSAPRVGGPGYQMPPPELTASVDRKRKLVERSQVIYTFILVALIIGTVWLYFGPYGSTVVELGEHDSRLITARPFFVDSIKLKNRYGTDGPLFYMFDHKPPLNQESRWLDSQSTTLVPGLWDHWEYFYWMNKGSTVKVDYTLDVREKGNVYLALIRDNPEDLQEYYEKPNAVSQPLQGRGVVTYDVNSDADYAFSLVSYNPDNVTVSLNLQFLTREYSTASAMQHSALKTNSKIGLQFFRTRYGLLTGPGNDKMGVDIWEIELSYGVRWTAVILIYGLVTLVYLISKQRMMASIHDELDPTLPEYAPLPPQETQATAIVPAPAPAAPSAPIIPGYDTFLEEESTDLKDKDTEKDIPEDKLCVICLERPKDSFFIPCGHNATCYTCGLKISQDDHPKCPICRQPIGDFKKLYDA